MSEAFLPYSRQNITDQEIEAVVNVLKSPMLSQGEQLVAFEKAFAEKADVAFAVAFSSGTAALHGMCFAAGITEEDEVIVPPITFAGTSNAVLYAGGIPVFADIDLTNSCLDPEAVKEKVSCKTKAILTVDFAGRPSEYQALQKIADEHGLLLLADAAHAAGGSENGKAIGSLADMTAFSFNPIKNMTAGEGGMVTTDNPEFAERLKMFSLHGMTRNPDLIKRKSEGGWYYEQHFLGFNYKLSELHAALGLVQLSRLDEFNARRREIVQKYDKLLADLPLVLPNVLEKNGHTWHLYVVRTADAKTRSELFKYLRDAQLGVQVHYIPVPMHPFYQEKGYSMDGLPNARRYYDTAISLPVHPSMNEADQIRVVDKIEQFYRN